MKDHGVLAAIFLAREFSGFLAMNEWMDGWGLG